MKDIEKIINTAKEDLNKTKVENKNISIEISYVNFLKYFKIIADKILAIRKEKREFIIDELNKDVINQWYCYLTGQENKFNGSLNKGICLIGAYGCGKTIINLTCLEIWSKLSGYNHYICHSRTISKDFLDKGLVFFSRRVIHLDELGKEHPYIVDYGTKIYPVNEILLSRYDNGAITHATSNFTLKSLEEVYENGTLSDRLKSMFNFIELKGKSRRT